MKQFNYIAALFVILVSLLSCVKDISSERRHPNKENIYTDSEVSFIINDNISNNNSNLAHLSARIRDASPATDLNQDKTLIGDIVDAVLSGDSLFLLDSQAMSVLIFDTDGNYLSSLSRQGRGPGEFVNPTEINSHSNSLFVLNDQAFIQEFKQENHEYTFHAQTDLQILPNAMCLNDSHLFVKTYPITDESSSMEDMRSIAVFENDNLAEAIFSFGNVYDSEFWGVSMILNTGGIECAPDSKSIVHYMNYLGQLTAFNNKGELLWKSKFKPFNHIILHHRSDGAILPDETISQDTFDSISRTAPVNSDYFLVQIQSLSLKNSADYEPVLKTYLIDFNTGEGVFVTAGSLEFLSVDIAQGRLLAKDISDSSLKIMSF